MKKYNNIPAECNPSQMTTFQYFLSSFRKSIKLFLDYCVTMFYEIIIIGFCLLLNTHLLANNPYIHHTDKFLTVLIQI